MPDQGVFYQSKPWSLGSIHYSAEFRFVKINHNAVDEQLEFNQLRRRQKETCKERHRQNHKQWFQSRQRLNKYDE